MNLFDRGKQCAKRWLTNLKSCAMRREAASSVSFDMAEDESSTTSEESLDITSDKFDPLKALYSSKIQLTSPAAPQYDNISKFESILTGRIVKRNDGTKETEAGSSKTASTINVRGVGGRKKGQWNPEGKNIITKMQKMLGPLGMLYTYMENRIRIKVYTRNARGIRGHVEAYVAAFDKHWNLALEDCFEVWTRKLKRKAPALGMPCSAKPKGPGPAREEVPKSVVTKIEGKRETLERHVPQMLLRGEQVAIIVKIN